MWTQKSDIAILWLEIVKVHITSLLYMQEWQTVYSALSIHLRSWKRRFLYRDRDVELTVGRQNWVQEKCTLVNLRLGKAYYCYVHLIYILYGWETISRTFSHICHCFCLLREREIFFPTTKEFLGSCKIHFNIPSLRHHILLSIWFVSICDRETHFSNLSNAMCINMVTLYRHSKETPW